MAVFAIIPSLPLGPFRGLAVYRTNVGDEGLTRTRVGGVDQRREHKVMIKTFAPTVAGSFFFFNAASGNRTHSRPAWANRCE
jgi:hypothetical protein